MKANPYLKNLHTVVFDIETTGLAPYRDRLILGGLHCFQTNETLQFFCENFGEEREIIIKTANALSKCDAIITYNGNSFDIPFFIKRAHETNVKLPQLLYQSVDIYKWLRNYWPQAKKMKNLRQKSIENALGLAMNRTDSISGGDCIALYENYMTSKDIAAKQAILLHNKDDLLQLKEISEALTFLPYHKIAYEQGFVTKVNHHKMIVSHVALKKTILNATGFTLKNLKDVFIYKNHFHFTYNAQSGAFTLSINCQENNGITYADLKELPVDSSNYKELSGFFRNLLIIKDEKEILYYEANKLIHDLIHHILTEDLQSWIKTYKP